MTAGYFKITGSDMSLVCRNAVPAGAAVLDDCFAEDRPLVTVKDASLTCRLLHCGRSSLQIFLISIVKVVVEQARITNVFVAEYVPF
jgi:hypothetical protein